MIKLTESESKYSNLEELNTAELLNYMNDEDNMVPQLVKKVIPQIEILVNELVKKLKDNGRLIYIGAGTSGRLGILDASECPPTFGVSSDVVVGLIAGGDTAIRHAVENAEDNKSTAWESLKKLNVSEADFVIGISASGSTPYVLAGLQAAAARGITTGCVVCNTGSHIAKTVDFPIEAVTGPEFITGSTRMKAGTAQKLILNMISTSAMIQLGRVKGNKMIDMKISNDKLIKRGVLFIMDELGCTEYQALTNLQKYGSVRAVLEHYND